MTALQPALTSMASSVLSASRLASQTLKGATLKQAGVRLIDHFTREVVDDIFACALKKQTGVSLKYM
jgi:pyruvate dehydrogenase kinase 2/3/4